MLPAECGTRGAYLRHHKADEEPCVLCLEAMRPIWKAADRKRRQRRIDMLAPCGTPAAYRRHLRWGEPVDNPCRQAATDTAKTWRHEQAHKKRRGKTIDVVADYVETWRPVELRELVLLIRLRHDIKEATIRRTVYKLLTDGRLLRDIDIV